MFADFVLDDDINKFEPVWRPFEGFLLMSVFIKLVDAFPFISTSVSISLFCLLSK